MASSSTIDDFLSNTISSLCETVMVRKGMIWVDAHGGKGATYALLEDEWDKETVELARGKDAEATKSCSNNQYFFTHRSLFFPGLEAIRPSPT